MANDKFTVVGTNIQEKATVIWNVANHLFGYFNLTNMVLSFSQ